MVLDLLYLVAALVDRDVVLFHVDGIHDMLPVFYMLLSSITFYLVVTFIKGWISSEEQRLTKLFIALLSSFLVVEKVVSLSLKDVTNIILPIFFLYIHAQFTVVSMQSMYIPTVGMV